MYIYIYISKLLYIVAHASPLARAHIYIFITLYCSPCFAFSEGSYLLFQSETKSQLSKSSVFLV